MNLAAAQMARLTFASSIRRHVAVDDTELHGSTVREILDGAFALEPGLRGYVLDDQDGLRFHVLVYIDGAPIRDRRALSDRVGADAHVHVLQALSGG